MHESQFCLRFFYQAVNAIGAQSTSPSVSLVAFMPLNLVLRTLLQVQK